MDDTESMVPVVPVLDVRRLRWLLVDRWHRTPLDSESVGVSGGGCAALLVAREMRTPTQPRGVKQCDPSSAHWDAKCVILYQRAVGP
jgi:hypothetical protein